jgi:DNA (cytosine-5)-methyltransferase 1
VTRTIHTCLEMITTDSPVSAVDLFCGAGGLTHGLRRTGIAVEAGIDLDGQMKYAYEKNNPGMRPAG